MHHENVSLSKLVDIRDVGRAMRLDRPREPVRALIHFPWVFMPIPEDFDGDLFIDGWVEAVRFFDWDGN